MSRGVLDRIADPTHADPPDRPDGVARLPEPARRDGRRGSRTRVAAALSAVLAILLGTSLAGDGLVHSGVGRPAGDSAAPSGPSLPSRTARWSPVTADTTDSPGGRAIVMYQQDVVDDLGAQIVVVGADADTYRTFDAGGQLVLSPDGTRMLAVGLPYGTSATVTDLTTGAVRRYGGIPPTAGVVAWSPDGRLVAFAGDGPGTCALCLLDTGSGAVTSVRMRSARMRTAAFSPDGRRLAVEPYAPAEPLQIVGVDGTPARTITVPSDVQLVGGAAWSPDGDHLLTSWEPDGSPFSGFSNGLGLIDPDGPPVQTPRTVVRAGSMGRYVVQGWRDGDRLLVTGVSDQDVSELRLSTGELERIARFGTYGPFGQAVEPRFASALVPDLTIREPGPTDRGPRPSWMSWWTSGGLVVCSAAVALAAVLAVRFAVRRRSRGRPGRSPDGTGR